MSQATAIAHPNIALIKYWGKRDLPLNLPAVPSLSLTLGPWCSRTTVTWGVERDEVHLDGRPASDKAARRVLAFLARVDPDRPRVRVHSANDFPTAAGLASSASGFAALALAADRAAGHGRSLEALSVLARQGSGSACRSLWGGFVVWQLGERADGTDSHGLPLAPEDHWDLSMVVAVVHAGPKAVGSTEGMERSRLTSPLYPGWVERGPGLVAEATAAVERRDLQALGELMEQSTFEMHAAMQTARPPLLYWQAGTVAALHTVFDLRARGIGAWATMDAGPQVKVLCASSDAEAVKQALSQVADRVEILHPGGPARVEQP